MVRKLKKDKPCKESHVNSQNSLLMIYEGLKPILKEVIGEKISKNPNIILDKNFREAGEYLFEEKKIRIGAGPESTVKMALAHEIVHHIIGEKFPMLSKTEKYIHFEEGLGRMIEKRASRIFERTEKKESYLLATFDDSLREIKNAFKYNCYINYRSIPKWVKIIDKIHERFEYFSGDDVKIKYGGMNLFINRYTLGNGVFSIFSKRYGDDFYKQILKSRDFSIFLKK